MGLRAHREDPACPAADSGSGTAGRLDRIAASLRSSEEDILERHDRVAREARRFRAQLNADGVVLLDAALQITYAGATTVQMLGRTQGEIVGHHPLEFIHPDDRDDVDERLRALMAEPRAFVAASFRVLRPDGTLRFIEGEASNLLDDPEIAAIVSKYRDVTDRRLHDRVARETREELGRLSHALEQTADTVIVTDRNGVIEYVNPAFEQMTGYTRAEALGQTPRLVNSGRQTRQFYETMWTTLLSGSALRIVVTNRRKDGSLYDEDQTIAPIRGQSGEITHFVSTGRDITEARRTQDALRRLNHQFENEATRIASVLHDQAGQFLTAAHLQLAELSSLASAATADQCAGKIDELRETLTQVEEQLRQLSHEIHPRAVIDLGMSDAITFFAEAFARRTGLVVSLTLPPPRRYPLAIETLIYRLVQEALTNISRHARATTVLVNLTRDGLTLRCSIADNGIGFDPGKVEADASVSLGLSLIRDRLQVVGGTLTIESQPGGGTKVTALVPIEA